MFHYEEYVEEVQKLSYKLLELISLSLGLSAKRMNGFFKDQTSFVRLNHYPPCPIPHLALGVGRHKDAGGLTILAQDDIGGLEVETLSREDLASRFTLTTDAASVGPLLLPYLSYDATDQPSDAPEDPSDYNSDAID
ncbi:hypothetical protein FXO38_11720 [Capsicum annuum]|uniref:Isopenicillin N synthase-like Fe(2+) 2OG dioxygenase domain-containing protein n=1 Tax=Capsicum annuum TaxID=4072 RepID=A0A2G2YNG6_CAPAN|nr:hypothetical protein FXO38_11720 [Capsicum annuum]PHT71235.1 hypothetical protein T459_26339 [Capsicum annuum]